MEKNIKWGIVGLGRIARAFAEGLKHTDNGTLHCVGSRDLDKAIKFAEEWDAPHSAGSYEELAKRCLLYTSPSPRDGLLSRMPSSA